MSGWARAVLLALAVCGAAWPAHGADMALLVGVADYPHLPRRLWLRGPVNDVALMRATLQDLGFAADDADVLVSRAGGAREPTLANIEAALDRTVRRVQRGDRVVLFLAGHGAQQPQPPGRMPVEADGLDEVFLSADARQWDGGAAQAIPNALLDDRIGGWIDALVDRGATVWAFFDACHAAGLARGPEGGKAVRAVGPADLGLPIARARATLRARTTARIDGRVLVYAARGFEATTEEVLPRGQSLGAGRIHGVFSFELAQVLRNGAKTPQDLGTQLQRAYARAGRLAPVPQVLGDEALRLR